MSKDFLTVLLAGFSKRYVLLVHGVEFTALIKSQVDSDRIVFRSLDSSEEGAEVVFPLKAKWINTFIVVLLCITDD